MSRLPHTFTASYLLLIHEGKVLLLRRSNTGYEDGNYSVPAGHAEPGETFTQAIVREAKEEANVTLNDTDLRVSHVMHRSNQKDREYVDTFFIAENWSGEPTNMEPNKCDDLSWFPVTDLPKNIIPYVAQAIENSVKNVMYSEYGWK